MGLSDFEAILCLSFLSLANHLQRSGGDPAAILDSDLRQTRLRGSVSSRYLLYLVILPRRQPNTNLPFWNDILKLPDHFE